MYKSFHGSRDNGTVHLGTINYSFSPKKSESVEQSHVINFAFAFANPERSSVHNFSQNNCEAIGVLCYLQLTHERRRRRRRTHLTLTFSVVVLCFDVQKIKFLLRTGVLPIFAWKQTIYVVKSWHTIPESWKTVQWRHNNCSFRTSNVTNAKRKKCSITSKCCAA